MERLDPKGLATVLAGAIGTALRPLNARLAALERAAGIVPTASALPSTASATKPRVIHRGDWSPDRQYAPDDAVLHAGRLWRSKAHQVRTAPGSEYGSWE